MAIALEVAHREIHRGAAHWITDLRRKSPVAPAQEHGYVIAIRIGGNQIEMTVSVEVPRPEGHGMIARWERRRRGERSIPMAQEDVDRIVIGGRQIQLPVLVEVCRYDGHWIGARREPVLGRERPVP